jgi:hypothetical protein
MKNLSYVITLAEKNDAEKIETAITAIFNSFDAIMLINDAEGGIEQIRFVSQVGWLFTHALWGIVSESDEESDFKQLANLLSKVLRHPKLPTEIWNELMQAVNTTHSNGDKDIIDEMETSPEMLEKILTAYQKKHGDEN